MQPVLNFRQAFALKKVEEIEGGGVELKFKHPVSFSYALNRLLLAIVWKRIRRSRNRH